MRHNFNRKHCVKGKEEMLKVLSEERSPQKVCCTYCDVALKHEITVLEGVKEVPYRGVPVGWNFD